MGTGTGVNAHRAARRMPTPPAQPAEQKANALSRACSFTGTDGLGRTCSLRLAGFAGFSTVSRPQPLTVH